jgi:hypothetical protein
MIRSPEQIAWERAKEFFLISILPILVVTLGPAIYATQADLQTCANNSGHPCVIHWSVWISGLFALAASLVGTGWKYLVALNAAKDNIASTGTTAPENTVAAPNVVNNLVVKTPSV